VSDKDKWRYIDARSKRALIRLLDCGYPLKIDIEGEEFEVATYREDGRVYFYLIMTHAIEEKEIRVLLNGLMEKSESNKEKISKDVQINRTLTLDDLVTGFSKKE